LLGAINTIEPLLSAFCSRRRGRILVVASIAAYRGLPDSPGYCASKAGLRAHAEALRTRLGPYGVGVTVVCPGFFDSPMTVRFEGPTPFCLSIDRAARIVKRGVDRGGVGSPFLGLLSLG
jgi:NAD(P)-dependent dehydrogenase (short-subunit alcohol dehydrogenase family)